MKVNYSIGRVLLLTWVIISSSQCDLLLSNETKTFIRDNKLVQHLILFIMIMVLMSLFGNPLSFDLVNNESINLVLVSVLVYAWFILITKLNITWNFGILILLCLYFLYENKQTNDIVLQSFNLNNNDMQKYILLALFGTTLIGTYFNAINITNQTGGSNNVDILNFLIS